MIYCCSNISVCPLLSIPANLNKLNKNHKRKVNLYTNRYKVNKGVNNPVCQTGRHNSCWHKRWEGLAESPSCTLLQLQCFLSGLAHHPTVLPLRDTELCRVLILRLPTLCLTNLSFQSRYLPVYVLYSVIDYTFWNRYLQLPIPHTRFKPVVSGLLFKLYNCI